MAGGQGNGRRKIEIKRIEGQPARQVTFSKRKTGVFKKASELSIMCGAQTAIVVFSPAGKPFSFGHPVVESTIDRFLSLGLASDEGESIGESRRASRIQQLHQELNGLSNLWDIGNKHRQALLKSVKENEQKLIREPIGNLKVHELQSLQASMETTKQRVIQRAMEMNVNVSPLGSFFDQNVARMDFPYHPHCAEMPPYRFGSQM